jgi:hypothetical protein
MTIFPETTLRDLRKVLELKIRTERHPNCAVTIWVVVAGEDAFVRSWAGTKGRWYRDLGAGGPATLEYNGNRLPVQAFPASDPQSVARASAAFQGKYRQSSHAGDMVRPEILSTTLRLEPR